MVQISYQTMLKLMKLPVANLLVLLHRPYLTDLRGKLERVKLFRFQVMAPLTVLL